MPKEIEQLAAQYLNKPVKVKIGRVSVPTANVAQTLQRCQEPEKVELLVALLQVRSETNGILIGTLSHAWVGPLLEVDIRHYGTLRRLQQGTEKCKAAWMCCNHRHCSDKDWLRHIAAPVPPLHLTAVWQPRCTQAAGSRPYLMLQN